MIQRRRPIESAIAERKMFNMGGMAVPMPQPTYMDLMQQGIMGMPQQVMGMPQQAQGIMASSQPLVDAIAGDANNPAGGDTLSMAQGGAVGFANGGAQYDPSEVVTSERVNQRPRTPSENLQLLFPAERAAGLLDQPGIGIGKGPGELYSDEPSITRRIVGMVPGRAGTALEGAAQVGETIGDVVDSFLGARFRGQQNLLSYLFSEEEEASGRSLNERYGLKEILSRISPELKQQNPNIERDILEIGANLVGKTGSQQEFMETVADQYAQIQEAPFRMEEGDEQEFAQDDSIRQVDDFTIAQQPVGDESLNYRDELNKKIGEYRIAMGQGPEAQMKFAQELSANPGFSQSFKDEVFQSADVESPVNAGAVPRGDQEQAAAATGDAMFSTGMDDTLAGGETPDAAEVPRPKEKPPVSNAGPLAGTEAPVGGVLDEVDAAAYTAANQAANILDTDKKAGPKDIAAFKKEFMEAMPKYEGMSEEEKGFLIAEAGLRVMAGKDPNAITNIAEGLKGLGPALMKGAKEKRAWNRQVELSAAKYALTGTEKLRTEERALAAEGRKRPFELIATKDYVDEVTGLTVKRGTAVPLTNEQITDGYLTKYPLTYRESFISDAKATAKLAELANKGRIKPNLFSADRRIYLENARSIKNGLRMKGLLMEAAKIAIPENAGDSQVLGVVPLFKSWVNKGFNAAGYQDTVEGRQKLSTLRSTKPEEYRVLMKTIGTTMVTEILNESNKTISEGDRARVDDLVAAYSDFDGTVASYKSLLLKLNNLEKTIDAGIEGASKSMKGIETNWGESEFIGGGTAAGTLSSIRNFSGRPASYSVGDRRSTSIPYKDIINMETRKFTPKYQNIFGKKASN